MGTDFEINRTGSGFAELKDVNAQNGGGFSDFQDSFLFAEVLKYAYLIHGDVSFPSLFNSYLHSFLFSSPHADK